MLRLLFVLFNMVGITLMNIFMGSDVVLTMSTPNTISAGSEFDIEVVLKKGDLNGFARYQQQLPLGLTAQLVESSFGDFSFEDQKVKFIWLQIPSDKEIKFTYRVKVDERLKGEFNLKGNFSYIVNNERKSTDAESSIITINPSSRIDPNLIVDIHEFQNILPIQAPLSLLASNVRCIRQTPMPTGEANDLMVRLLVNKANTEKFAKIEEDIPAGFNAEAIDAKDAIFTFKDQKVKFLWMNLPPDPKFVVSYRLIPTDGKGDVTVKILGKFSYIVNEATRVIDIIQKDIDLSNLDPKNLDGILASTISSTVFPEGQTLSSSFTQVDADGGVNVPISYQEIKDRPKKTVKSEPNMLPYMLEPEKGVYYRVQVAAGHRPINIKKYFLRYKISHEVRTEKHEGWYKYSIGSFNEYKEARDFRMMTWNTTKVNDAFVAAYNNGKRITVQEALMITNQQWYR
ncbi:MAG: SPOR domain-containing protein [Bacteroidales bacterium]